jgi:hypothetical protein
MDINLAVWILPIVLFVVTLILLLYLAILNWAPVRKESASAPAKQRPINSSSVQNPVVLAPPPPPAPVQPQYQMPVQQQYAPPPAPVMPAPVRPPDATELDTMGKMVIITGLEPREIPLPSTQFAIGRFYSPENNVLVSIDEKSVSRKHAALRIAGHGREYYLQDVGSSYGTHMFVEGRVERLTPGQEARLYNNDIVQFGSAVQVRFVLPCETRSAVTQL